MVAEPNQVLRSAWTGRGVLLIGAAVAVHRATNCMSWIHIKEQKVIKTWMLSISSSKNAGLYSAGKLQFPHRKGFISEVIDISLILLKQWNCVVKASCCGRVERVMFSVMSLSPFDFNLPQIS
jgi:hypothetical protein